MALHRAHDAREPGTWRHEITDPNRSGVGLPPSVQDTGAVSIGSTEALLRAHRCDTPKAVVVSADQGSEACGGIEARKAEPVDRPILGDHGSAFEVSYEGVVLDWFTHDRNTPSNTSRSLHFTASHAFAHPPTDRPARPKTRRSSAPSSPMTPCPWPVKAPRPDKEPIEVQTGTAGSSRNGA